MAGLTRYDPFDIARRLDPFQDLDDLFKGFFVRPIAFEGQPQLQIKMNVKENDKSYTVHADIPGVKKKDIKVTIEGNQISINTEMKKEKEKKENEKMLRNERYYGKISHTFTLTHNVDETKTQTKYNNSILNPIPSRVLHQKQ